MRECNKYIDPVKMGRFMSQCRKEKKLTQEYIATEFGITSQSVSKWESGKTAPDITILIRLSELLGVEVQELLLGEKDNSSNKITKEEKINQAFAGSVKFYEDKSKKRFIKIIAGIFIFFLIFIFSILFLYYVNNYNKVNIYSIYKNDNLVLNGKIIFNPKKKTILINKLKYNDIYTGTEDEIMAKKVFIKIVKNDSVILEYECSDNYEDSAKPLNDFLEKVNIESSSDISKDEYKLIKEELDNLEVVITYSDKKDNLYDLEFPLVVDEEFSNNSLFY